MVNRAVFTGIEPPATEATAGLQTDVGEFADTMLGLESDEEEPQSLDVVNADGSSIGYPSSPLIRSA